MIMITRDCEACTHPGNPAFHSAICNHHHHHHLHWHAGAGSSLFPIRNVDISKSNSTTNQSEPSSLSPWLSVSSSKWMFGRVVDPRSKAIQRRNRATLLARATALAIDPLFFYALTVGIITSSIISDEGHVAAEASRPTACLYVDGGFLAAVTALRTCVDAVHVWHVWLQLRLAYVSRESLVVGCGKLVWNARAIAIHYLSSIRGFWFDLFVILPIPQMVFWLVVPRLIRKEAVVMMLSLILLIFLFQFLPKVYHSIFLMKKMQKVTGYVFGTIWWGFALNFLAYFIASHVAGCCWYILAIQRVASCLHQQCQMNGTCNTRPLTCSKEICYKSPQPSNFMDFSCFGNQTTSITSTSVIPDCLDTKSTFRFGIYRWALPVITSNSLAVKILYPIFWGLMALSTFGNVLEPTSQLLEVIFSIAIVLSGLLLFTLLIGNIQVFLHSVMARKRMMQLRGRDLEWWMKRRQLPTRLRQRVQHHERQRWVTMRGEDEMSMIKDVPQGLRRDIKRHLCLDLIKQIPLFNDLDDLILDNICDRVKPLVFSEDEKIIREGDPVQRMVFIVQGELESTQKLSKGMVATCSLGPGNFLGDELLSWCLRRPFIDRLPPSSSTFICLRPTEAFALDAADLKYITEHFRYKFANEKLKRTARHYSSSWRTWAAVNIQLAWRRYRKRMSQPIPDAQNVDDQDTRLRHYADVFLSLRPHDHLE